ncbi:MFS transporter [Kineosporia sp. J2-2]|uniref:MFS transporter n=1 Tax=Kineosporia corallincola TaxID=2835133 RepID=A0ABS5TP71_9ACTN|nr:MFS transporter [Kineosporia corallincola]MBT0772896.1 MFS transporter [Kineosporia corallincola]
MQIHDPLPLGSDSRTGTGEDPPDRMTGKQWLVIILASMASFLDGGAMGATATTLAVFKTGFGLSDTTLGVLVAVGPVGLGCGVGALIGGRLGDRLGRKRIYKWDLLVFALGALIVAASQNPAMLLIGAAVLGLGVGADIPTSLALVSETAPARIRGKMVGFTMVTSSIGPLVVIFTAFAVSPLGLAGARIVFALLLVIALVTWAMRQGMAESVRWRTAVESGISADAAQLFRGANLKAFVWTAMLFVLFVIPASTGGTFTPYITRALGIASQAQSVMFSAVSIASTMIGSFVFMRFVDRTGRHRRIVWSVGVVLELAAYLAFLLLPFSAFTVVFNTLAFGIGAGLAGEGMYKLFSQELFPTMLRSSAQGFTYFAARVTASLWGLLVPVLLSASGITVISAVLVAAIAVMGVIGFFMPATTGRSLEDIELERNSA